MKEQINIGQFCLPFFLILDPSFVDAQHVTKNLLAQAGHKNVVLLYRAMEGEGSQELPYRLVNSVCGYWVGRIRVGNSNRWEERQQVRGKQLKEMVKNYSPVDDVSM